MSSDLQEDFGKGVARSSFEADLVVGTTNLAIISSRVSAKSDGLGLLLATESEHCGIETSWQASEHSGFYFADCAMFECFFNLFIEYFGVMWTESPDARGHFHGVTEGGIAVVFEAKSPGILAIDIFTTEPAGGQLWIKFYLPLHLDGYGGILLGVRHYPAGTPDTPGTVGIHWEIQ